MFSKPLISVKHPLTFYRFVFHEKEQRNYCAIGIVAGIIYLILLRLLFPFPSFYADSYTYIDAAADNLAISYRPIQYSEFINFFHHFGSSDFALIASQYLANVIANLFLFFTCVFLFPLSRLSKNILFAILVFNPLYLFAANFVLSDSLFCSLTVAWFTLLLWVIYKPNVVNMLGQFILMILLFKLRYNALIFPAFTTLALLFSKQALWRKISVVIVSFGIMFLLVQKISEKTESLTGTHTFSAFSGWQMASNAMHIQRHIPETDTADFDDDELAINQHIVEYFAAHKNEPYEEVTAAFIWDKGSPLKKYLYKYGKKNGYSTYFETWTALGPVYNQFGVKVISQHPAAYLQYFLWPNTKRYFLPQMEAYSTYNEGRDSVDKSAAKYYHYRTNKITNANAKLHVAMLAPWEYLFPVLNFIFILAGLLYVVMRAYKKAPRLFNQALILFSTFYLGNLFFVSAVAPNVFRYHLFIITLAIPFIIYLCSFLIGQKEKAQ
ncbi:hypothetical protein FLA_6283 [Filimonas lacunae]|nr:hypothetical protein FLA_6283 [Filimonas lacunae]